jgi:regulator of sigma E protease
VGPRVTTVVERVDPGTPAAEAGLRAEDRILAVDEMEVIGPMHLLDLIGERAGKTTALLVRRGEEKITLTVVPRMPKGGTVGKIGIRIYPLSEAGTTIVRPSPIRQVKQVLLMMGNTLAALLHPKQTGVTPGDLSGPVGIGHILLITIAKGFVYALSFIVLININLAILNLLPIPVLDGGHVMFALIEAARRRPLSFRVASVIQSAFAALLITFIVYVTYNDVMRLFMSSRLKPKAPEKLEFTEPTPSEQHAPSPATPPPAPAP